MTKEQKLLKKLNSIYARLHTRYENLFWDVYMGDHSLQNKMDEAQNKQDAFCADSKMMDIVEEALVCAKGKDKENLEAWKLFFEKYQTPKELIFLKEQIVNLESKIYKKQNSRKEGYVDPYTNKFVIASINTLGNIVYTHDDEKVRKAAFEGVEKLALDCVDDYVKLVDMRNKYAHALGFEDFYAYKSEREEGMTKKEIFDLFEKIYEKTKYKFEYVRKLEKDQPRLRKPWNFGYMMAGDLTKEEDSYLQFKDALMRWGRSFAALGIDYQKGEIKLDMLDRKGKHSNGFCHWPKMVEYKQGKRVPGRSNFTCNVVVGKTGEGNVGMHTLFHEGGHATHLLNSTQTQVCFNNEYPPATSAWCETQSIFLQEIYGSFEWRSRYAKNTDGERYPFELYQKKVKKLQPLPPGSIMSIMLVSEFEKKVYECKNLTSDKVKRFAKQVSKKYVDRSVPSLWVLNAIHIYGWDSACSYHSYGLAFMAVEQWRTYLRKKYGYIIDNPKIGEELTKVWQLGSSKTFREFVKLATGKDLSAEPYTKRISRGVSAVLHDAKKKVQRLESVKKYTKPVKLNATIKLVHGKKTIATNTKSFEDMAEKYSKWLEKQVQKGPNSSVI